MALFPNAQNNPAGALPVWLAPGPAGVQNAVTVTDSSNALVAGVAETVLPADPARRYFLIQNVSVPAVDMWMSFVGAAVVGTAGSIKLAAGQTYESGPAVVGNAVSLIAASNTTATIWKG